MLVRFGLIGVLISLGLATAGGEASEESAKAGDRAFVGRDPGSISFAGYVVRIEDDRVVEQGGPWESVDDALMWARSRAEQVVLTYGTKGDTIYSAGDVYFDGGRGEGLPAWPPPVEVREAMDDAVRAAIGDSSSGGVLGVDEAEER